MTGRIVRYADTADTVWPNGGGTTRLMWSDAEDGRRISIATLRRPVEFSSLPGMLRTLVVLDPLLVGLKIDQRAVALTRGDMLNFHGAQHVTLITLDQPGRVLNVMSRIDSWEPQVSHDPAGAALTGWVAAHDIAWNGNKLNRGDLVLGVAPPAGMLAITFRPVSSSNELPRGLPARLESASRPWPVGRP